ncbi:MAG: bifunctional 5,10-methylenetetrahydrofolate dehydrogenase/5,10-methenyltetrahydrofolate cyclohydrolase [Candidatus Moranbacteria bacterium]|nr:bifunctional 5,10-methylenetetrahydrofolate dehydrogenase/5,10-methenyltetrahydrofolate cyclohydrolase [Candidatus Moranbacteria bacterium]
MKLLDGKKIADKKVDVLAEKVSTLNKQLALAVILVGNDSASHLYVKLKEKKAKEIGIELRKYIFNSRSDEKEILDCINFLNNDEDTQGIIVQLPLPEKFDQNKIVNSINPKKDVDGFHAENQKFFLNDEEIIYPVFPRAIMTLVKEIKFDFSKTKKAVVIGKSDVFDRVMTHALDREGFTSQFIKCDTVEDNLDLIFEADVVVSACGIPSLLKGEMFKDGATVIDGGISEIDNKTVGDVDRETCLKKNIFLSPVPNGVGPLTIACLLENVYKLGK